MNTRKLKIIPAEKVLIDPSNPNGGYCYSAKLSEALGVTDREFDAIPKTLEPMFDKFNDAMRAIDNEPKLFVTEVKDFELTDVQRMYMIIMMTQKMSRSNELTWAFTYGKHEFDFFENAQSMFDDTSLTDTMIGMFFARNIHDEMSKSPLERMMEDMSEQMKDEFGATKDCSCEKCEAKRNGE